MLISLQARILSEGEAQEDRAGLTRTCVVNFLEREAYDENSSSAFAS